MQCSSLRLDFIAVILQNNPAGLQLFVIILNCLRMPDRSQHAQVVNAVLFNMELITLPSWSTYICYFLASNKN